MLLGPPVLIVGRALTHRHGSWDFKADVIGVFASRLGSLLPGGFCVLDRQVMRPITRIAIAPYEKKVSGTVSGEETVPDTFFSSC